MVCTVQECEFFIIIIIIIIIIINNLYCPPQHKERKCIENCF